MPVIPQDRPIDTLREEITDQLVMNYSHGELSLEAFERRLDEAMATTDHDVLLELVADLDLKVDQQFTDNKNDQLGINYVPGNTEDVEQIIQIFSGNGRSGNWRLPKQIQIYSVFSGCEIDLTDAEFSQPEVHIQVFSLFSGESIYVPEGVNVKSNVFSIFAGVDNSVMSSSIPGAPTIIIEGVSLFSGINIEVKRTMKEKFVEFADKFKSLLS